ncbi:hypothetical protein [Methylophaga sp.]|jgi:hypothetical protein|uniref:hypothetical protein n=1 Tax=Methylophaga sp. TaxID=2024840 RepID=UPI003A957B48
MIKDFFTGGTSKAAHYGFATGLIARRLLRISLVISLFVVGVGFGQLKQAISFEADFRDYQLTSWANDNPERQAMVEQFRNECLSSSAKSADELPIDKPVSLKQCGENINAHELVAVLDKSAGVLHSVGWPLSLIN